jgi:hypothetical protein
MVDFLSCVMGARLRVCPNPVVGWAWQELAHRPEIFIVVAVIVGMVSWHYRLFYTVLDVIAAADAFHKYLEPQLTCPCKLAALEGVLRLDHSHRRV